MYWFSLVISLQGWVYSLSAALRCGGVLYTPVKRNNFAESYL
jgi:hypothetical protein